MAPNIYACAFIVLFSYKNLKQLCYHSSFKYVTHDLIGLEEK